MIKKRKNNFKTKRKNYLQNNFKTKRKNNIRIGKNTKKKNIRIGKGRIRTMKGGVNNPYQHKERRGMFIQKKKYIFTPPFFLFGEEFDKLIKKTLVKPNEEEVPNEEEEEEEEKEDAAKEDAAKEEKFKFYEKILQYNINKKYKENKKTSTNCFNLIYTNELDRLSGEISPDNVTWWGSNFESAKVKLFNDIKEIIGKLLEQQINKYKKKSYNYQKENFLIKQKIFNTTDNNYSNLNTITINGALIDIFPSDDKKCEYNFERNIFRKFSSNLKSLSKFITSREVTSKGEVNPFSAIGENILKPVAQNIYEFIKAHELTSVKKAAAFSAEKAVKIENIYCKLYKKYKKYNNNYEGNRESHLWSPIKSAKNKPEQCSEDFTINTGALEFLKNKIPSTDIENLFDNIETIYKNEGIILYSKPAWEKYGNCSANKEYRFLNIHQSILLALEYYIINDLQYNKDLKNENCCEIKGCNKPKLKKPGIFDSYKTYYYDYCYLHKCKLKGCEYPVNTGQSMRETNEITLLIGKKAKDKKEENDIYLSDFLSTKDEAKFKNNINYLYELCDEGDILQQEINAPQNILIILQKINSPQNESIVGGGYKKLKTQKINKTKKNKITKKTMRGGSNTILPEPKKITVKTFLEDFQKNGINSEYIDYINLLYAKLNGKKIKRILPKRFLTNNFCDRHQCWERGCNRVGLYKVKGYFMKKKGSNSTYDKRSEGVRKYKGKTKIPNFDRQVIPHYCSTHNKEDCAIGTETTTGKRKDFFKGNNKQNPRGHSVDLYNEINKKKFINIGELDEDYEVLNTLEERQTEKETELQIPSICYNHMCEYKGCNEPKSYLTGVNMRIHLNKYCTKHICKNFQYYKVLNENKCSYNGKVSQNNFCEKCQNIQLNIKKPNIFNFNIPLKERDFKEIINKIFVNLDKDIQDTYDSKKILQYSIINLFIFELNKLNELNESKESITESITKFKDFIAPKIILNDSQDNTNNTNIIEEINIIEQIKTEINKIKNNNDSKFKNLDMYLDFLTAIAIASERKRKDRKPIFDQTSLIDSHGTGSRNLSNFFIEFIRSIKIFLNIIIKKFYEKLFEQETYEISYYVDKSKTLKEKFLDDVLKNFLDLTKVFLRVNNTHGNFTKGDILIFDNKISHEDNIEECDNNKIIKEFESIKNNYYIYVKKITTKAEAAEKKEEESKSILGKNISIINPIHIKYDDDDKKLILTQEYYDAYFLDKKNIASVLEIEIKDHTKFEKFVEIFDKKIYYPNGIKEGRIDNDNITFKFSSGIFIARENYEKDYEDATLNDDRILKIEKGETLQEVQLEFYPNFKGVKNKYGKKGYVPKEYLRDKNLPLPGPPPRKKPKGDGDDPAAATAGEAGAGGGPGGTAGPAPSEDAPAAEEEGGTSDEEEADEAAAEEQQVEASAAEEDQQQQPAAATAERNPEWVHPYIRDEKIIYDYVNNMFNLRIKGSFFAVPTKTGNGENNTNTKYTLFVCENGGDNLQYNELYLDTSSENVQLTMGGTDYPLDGIKTLTGAIEYLKTSNNDWWTNPLTQAIPYEREAAPADEAEAEAEGTGGDGDGGDGKEDGGSGGSDEPSADAQAAAPAEAGGEEDLPWVYPLNTPDSDLNECLREYINKNEGKDIPGSYLAVEVKSPWGEKDVEGVKNYILYVLSENNDTANNTGLGIGDENYKKDKFLLRVFNDNYDVQILNTENKMNYLSGIYTLEEAAFFLETLRLKPELEEGQDEDQNINFNWEVPLTKPIKCIFQQINN